jgi:hypothetical protein
MDGRLDHAFGLLDMEEMWEKSLDMDKFWDAVHFLLTGESSFPYFSLLEESVQAGSDQLVGSPLSQAVIGSHPLVTDEDGIFVGYTKAEEIPALLQALNDVDIDTCIATVNYAELAKTEIYPCTWDEDDDEFIGGLGEEIVALREFYASAKETKSHVVIMIS